MLPIALWTMLLEIHKAKFNSQTPNPKILEQINHMKYRVRDQLTMIFEMTVAG